MPTGEHSIAALRAAAQVCEGCDLYERATQTVFGEGRVRTPLLMLVGEQPGDVEDRTGHPFVGPAGELLNEALAAVGIDRRTIYVTNAVKHFKWESRGKLRLHKNPSAREVAGCRPWLLAEIAAVRPKMLLCRGRVAPPGSVTKHATCTPHRSCAFVMRRSGVLPSITSSTIFALLLPIQGDCGTRTAGKYTTCPPRPRDNDPRALTKRRPQMVDSNPTTPIAPTRYRTPTAMTPDLSRATPGSWPATGYSPLG